MSKIKHLLSQPLAWIVIVNVLLFVPGLTLVVTLLGPQAEETTIATRGEQELHKVIFSQDLRESGFVITDKLAPDSSLVRDENAEYTGNSTIIMLPAGAYTINYQTSHREIISFEFLVMQEGDTEVDLPAADRPAVTPALTNIELVNPLDDCDGYEYSRGFSNWHGGIDLAKEGGCWINAAADGTVLFAGWNPEGYGFMVILEHEDGFVSKYSQGSGEFKVETGEKVTAGQAIMFMGNTGYSTGTHLHMELMHDGIKVDPALYIDFDLPEATPQP